MKKLSLQQLRDISHAGGVADVTLKAEGSVFFIKIHMQSGGNAILTKTRNQEPRGFGDPRKAIALLQQLGINIGQFDAKNWTPEIQANKARPARAEAMRKAHEAAAYNEWIKKEIEESRNDPRPNFTHEEVMAKIDTFIQSLKDQGR